MNKEERAEFIRLRFRAKGGIAYLSEGKKLTAFNAPTGNHFQRRPLLMALDKHKVEWLKKPDEPQKNDFQESRLSHLSPLMRIAAHYPVRLPRA